MTPVRQPRVAYLMSRFPKLSETFVLYEIVELERQGVHVEIFPLMHHRETTMHPDAVPLVARAHYMPFFSWMILLAQLIWLGRRPLTYLTIWLDVLRGMWGEPKNLAKALLCLPKAAYFALQIERLGISHIHAHFANHPTLVAMMVARLTAKPFSFTAHAHDIYRSQKMLAAKIGEAAFVLAISQYNRRFLLGVCPASDRVMAEAKVSVHYLGVNVEDFRPREARPDGQPLTLLCVARLQPNKGQRLLVEACDLLRRRGLEFRCRLVGDGADRPLLEQQIAELGLQGYVELLGAQPRECVRQLQREADVAVLPSLPAVKGRQDGLPISLVEALASGVPAIGGNVSGVPELITHGEEGLLVEPGDANALADAIARLAADSALRAAMGCAGRAKVVAQHNQEQSVARLRLRFACNTIAEDFAAIEKAGTNR